MARLAKWIAQFGRGMPIRERGDKREVLTVQCWCCKCRPKCQAEPLKPISYLIDCRAALNKYIQASEPNNLYVSAPPKNSMPLSVLGLAKKERRKIWILSKMKQNKTQSAKLEQDGI